MTTLTLASHTHHPHTQIPTARTQTGPSASYWVESWLDPVVAEFGHAIRSDYVERFWLGLLGPSSTWLLRAISYGFDAQPNGFSLPVAETARVLGLGDRVGRHSPFQRSVNRLCSFGLAYMRSETLVVRTMIPWLEPRQVRRLSTALQREHTIWEQVDEDRSAVQANRRRAAAIAMSTVRTGGNVDDAERSLVRANAHPSLSRSLAEWAWEQHQLSVQAAKRGGPILEL